MSSPVLHCLLLLVWRGGDTASQREIYALLLDRKGKLSASAISQLSSVQNNRQAKAYFGLAYSDPFHITAWPLEADSWVSITVLPLHSSIKYLLSIYYVPGLCRG